MNIITIITKFRFKKLFRGDYRLNALFKDFIIGGMSLQVKIRSKYDHANANQSTDYKMLSAIFKKIKLSPDDIFVDVGCGYGRVISYLLMKRYKNRFIGVELEKDFAEVAKKRLKRFNNVSIVCGNIIDVFPTDATFFYLFNPFDEFILAQFLEKVENITHKITVIYCNCKYNDLFRNRVGWIVREEGTGIHAKNFVMNYVIFEHMPIIH